MELNTKRLCLRPFNDSDFEAVHSYSSNPDNVTYMVWGPNDEEATREFIKEAIHKLEQEPIMGYDFAIVLRETGEVIGGCGIYLDDSRQVGVLGWILHQNYWKKGFMPEAANELLRFGFEYLNLHRIYATCNSENYGSYRVMEKCGMLREAHFRKNRHGRIGDMEQWYDEYHYAMLAEEWKMLHS